MPKLKTHKGIKKRFKVSATGKVSHKKCGSSHLMSHKSGKQVRRLRKKVQLKVLAEARRIRKAVHTRPGANYTEVEAIRQGIVAEEAAMAAESWIDPATMPSEPFDGIPEKVRAELDKAGAALAARQKTA